MMKCDENQRAPIPYFNNNMYLDSHDSNFSDVHVQFQPLYNSTIFILVCVVLLCMIVSTVFGNVLVVAAVLLERKLRSASNYLILSLAVCDLMVAVLVMPLSAINEIADKWWLGISWCDVWVCLDVLCCTASILHLVVIAIDRYRAVTQVKYMYRRSTPSVLLSIGLVWLISAAISVPARFHNHRSDEEEHRLLMVEGRCIVNPDSSYTVLATIASFYVPTLVLCYIYTHIFLAAKRRIRRSRTVHPAVRENKTHSSNFLRRVLSSFRLPQSRVTPMLPQGSSVNATTDHLSQSMSRPSAGLVPSPSILLTHSFALNENKIRRWNQMTWKYADEELNGSRSRSAVPRPDSAAILCSVPETSDSAIPATISRKATQNVFQTDRSSSGALDEPTGMSVNDDTECREPLILASDSKKTTPSSSSASNLLIEAPSSSSMLRPTSSPNLDSQKRAVQQVRERKAARTLSIITGAFLLCWSPFFLHALIMPLCTVCNPLPRQVSSFLLWLGYTNSLLNPVLYTVFSPDFRYAFRKLLLGKCIVPVRVHTSWGGMANSRIASIGRTVTS